MSVKIGSNIIFPVVGWDTHCHTICSPLPQSTRIMQQSENTEARSLFYKMHWT